MDSSDSSQKPKKGLGNTILKAIAGVFIFYITLYGTIYVLSHISSSGSTGNAIANGVQTILPIYKTVTETIFSGSINVPPLTYRYITFDVPSNARDVQLNINIVASGGWGNNIILYVMNYPNFVNYENGNNYYVYYNSGKETYIYTTVNLPNGGGEYVIVLDNTFSIISTKTVTGTITLSYQVPVT